MAITQASGLHRLHRGEQLLERALRAKASLHLCLERLHIGLIIMEDHYRNLSVYLSDASDRGQSLDAATGYTHDHQIGLAIEDPRLDLALRQGGPDYLKIIELLHPEAQSHEGQLVAVDQKYFDKFWCRGRHGYPLQT